MVIVYRVENPQTVSVALTGPDSANRLFVFSGIALVDWRISDDRLHADMAELDLSFWHGTGDTPRADSLFGPRSTEVAAVAWPSSMHADDAAAEATWAVDRVNPDITLEGRLRLNLFLALQGEDCALMRIGYHAFARTTSVPLLRISIVPNDIDLSNRHVPIAITLQLRGTAPAGGQPVMLTSSSGGLSLPQPVLVPGNSAVTTVAGDVNPVAFPPGDSTVTVTATTPLSRLDFPIAIHK